MLDRVLTKTAILDGSLCSIEDVRCEDASSTWSPGEVSARDALVFVRAGSFRRRVEGMEMLVDPSSAYFERRGREQQVAHPFAGGDACTQVLLSERLVAAVVGEGGALPETPIPTTPQMDLGHRFLLAACRRRAPVAAIEETLVQMIGRLILRHEDAGEPRTGTARGHRRLASDARAALTADPTLTLIELADQLAVSPYHLSRTFRRHNGLSFSRFRTTVRMRLAMERLESGATLADIAADLGFADHAHLTRTFRKEIGDVPSRLRQQLAV